MHAVLIGFGSAGDVNPLIAIGRTLKARGHRVTIIANGHFASSATGVGLEFVEFGTEEQYIEGTQNPDGSHPIKGMQGLMATVGDATGILYEMIVSRFASPDTVLVATSLAFGARVAQEKLGIPLVTVHLCPMAFRSAYENLAVPGVFQPAWTPRALRRFGWWAGDRLILDPHVEPGLNACLTSVGLAKVSRPCHTWWHSTTRVLGLFPRWFGEPQPDWPAKTLLTGFIRDRTSDEPPLAPELEAFLAAGDAPIVFTPGSANRHGRVFFETAAIACERLKARALFVTAFPEQLPASLPLSILRVRFAPFGRLLPRARALVYHGGIGTAAQAMAAGIPHLVVPVGYDQPDNGRRLADLGIGRVRYPRAFHPDGATRDLAFLLGSTDVARACRDVAQRFTPDTAREDACAVIEAMLPLSSVRQENGTGRVEERKVGATG